MVWDVFDHQPQGEVLCGKVKSVTDDELKTPIGSTSPAWEPSAFKVTTEGGRQPFTPVAKGHELAEFVW